MMNIVAYYAVVIDIADGIAQPKSMRLDVPCSAGDNFEDIC